MTTEERNFVLFKNDLFLSRQRDEDLDAWSVGGDCAAWIYVRLFMSDRIRPGRDPGMEDWGGWSFEVVVNDVEGHDVTVHINVWPYFLAENHWLLGIVPANPVYFWGRHPPDVLRGAQNAVCDAIEGIIVADPRFEQHRWFAENPLL